MLKRHLKYPLLAGVSGLLAAPVPLLAQAQSGQEGTQQEQGAASHNVTAGYYYSKGDYGQDTDTTIHYFPLSYDVTVAGWNLKASTAHLEISGVGNVLVNVGGVGREMDNLTDYSDETGTWRGVGDTILTATYQMPARSETGPFLDLGFEVKIPTADENKGLGTGATDYGVQLDVYQTMGVTTLFGTLGYRFRGTSSVFEGMENSAFVSLGFSRPLNEAWSYGLIYDFREAASRTSMETHELLPFISWRPAPRWTLMSYVAEGFTRDSADFAIGAQLGYRW